MYQANSSTIVQGHKEVDGKARWELVDMNALDAMVDTLTYGAQKYEDNDWQKVDNPEDVYFAALMRHLVAWRKGEVTDISGCSHMAHVMANAMFLEHFVQQKQK